MADVSTILQPIILPDTSAGAEPRSYWSTVGERLSHDRITLAVGAVLLCVILLAIFAPWAATHDPLQGSAPVEANRHAGLLPRHRRDRKGYLVSARLWWEAVADLRRHPRCAGNLDRRHAGPRCRDRRACREHGNHAGRRCVLRLSVGTAG